MQKKLTETECYTPAEDTIFFANHIQNEKGKYALDIGTGSGYLAKVLSPNFDLVVATDINQNALKKARLLIENCICCDSTNALSVKFDLVICNMPYLPSDKITDVAVDGLDGGILIPLKILKSAKNVTKKGGKLLFLTSSLANYNELLRQTELMGFETRIIARMKLFFEELILVEAIKK